jgi:hypothetical protein
MMPLETLPQYDQWKLAAPERPEPTLPPGMVPWDEWYDLVKERLREALASLGDYGTDWDAFDITGDAPHVCVTLAVMPVAYEYDVSCGDETYYPADVAWDPRADVLWQLRRLADALERDIATRPIDGRVVTASQQLENETCD